ncbi:hypothetical protein [Natronobiforma cellulositropha]|uniref:hypothetical protein n=1 Tax=Natronobiforma cellulositropha TaxID=1679076 RepID=UPI0021D60C37|nr:hypothetical protein [Natronobiforma cellulositropha]
MTKRIRLGLGSARESVRDDRILPVTRLVGGIIAPILLVAFLILYGVPDRTTEFFAWTITPEMTPLVMGAGYGTGVYFFYRVVTIGEWHRVAPVFPGIAVFTWFVAIATVLHWENFNHGHVTFWLWVLLYAVSPFLIPGLWVLNQRTAPVEAADTGPQTPRLVRRASLLSGGGITVVSVVLFLLPGVMIEFWPWDVSPLTARILLGWFALLGTVNLVVALDPRWSAWRILVHGQLVGLSLVLLGAVRAWNDFDASNPTTWLVLGGLGLYLLGVLALYVSMEYR